MPLFKCLKKITLLDIAKFKWVRIVSIDNNGTLSSGLSTSVGPIKISAKVDHGWKAMEVIATIRRTFLNTEVTAIITELENKRTFGLGYEPTDDSWYVIANADLNKTGDWSPQYIKNISEDGLDASWLLKFSYKPSITATYSYTTEIRGQEYIVQSKNDLKFYNINNVKVADSFNIASRDQIILTKLNFKNKIFIKN